MFDFVMGAIGSLLVLLVFFAGAYTGWKVRDFWKPYKAETPSLTELEKKRKEDTDRAFQQMVGYNLDMVYGTMSGDDITDNGDDAR